MKVALIWGITGQDGSYLTEILLEKQYIVHGVIRRSSTINTKRIDHMYVDPHCHTNLYLHYGDLSDSSSIENIISKVQPDEIYNLAAMSHVRISFDIPEYTCNINGLGALRILEAIRKTSKCIKYYQASTSELYGGIYETPHNESTPFNPKSPYAISKLFAHWITNNYRESYNIFAVNGILHNHTSYRRGHTFIEQKIVQGVTNIWKGKQECLYLGNLYAKRDFGHAKDFCNAIYLMMQNDIPRDYVIASGKSYKIKDIVELVFNKFEMPIVWLGEGKDEIGYVNGVERVKIDERYFRPSEVDNLLGDASLAKRELGWKETYTFEEIIDEMIEYEINM